jgi:peroxiredoxin
MLEPGQMAPDFSLPCHLEMDIVLSSYRGKCNVALVFFPLAWTPI